MAMKEKSLIVLASVAIILAIVCSAGCVSLSGTLEPALNPNVPAAPSDSTTGLNALYTDHVINFESVNNARDLGGYPAADGKHVKKGLLIRSGNLASLSEKDADILENTYHLKHIIDFRTDSEHLEDVDKDVKGAEYHWAKVQEDFLKSIDELSNPGAFQEDEFNAEKLYEREFSDLLKRVLLYDELYEKELNGIRGEAKDLFRSEVSQTGYREFFRIILENAGEPILWHCIWGKDRTGVATILLLSALGVDREVILDDYELTNIAASDLLNTIETELRFYEPSDDTVARILCVEGVDRRNMIEALALIDSEYGGMDAYLHNQMGLTDADLEKLRAAYLE